MFDASLAAILPSSGALLPATLPSSGALPLCGFTLPLQQLPLNSSQLCSFLPHTVIFWQNLPSSTQNSCLETGTNASEKDNTNSIARNYRTNQIFICNSLQSFKGLWLGWTCIFSWWESDKVGYHIKRGLGCIALFSAWNEFPRDYLFGSSLHLLHMFTQISPSQWDILWQPCFVLQPVPISLLAFWIVSTLLNYYLFSPWALNLIIY